MKALLVIFTIYLSLIQCQKNKIEVKDLPKKVIPNANGKILINLAKHGITGTLKSSTTRPTVKSYTAFQVVGNPKMLMGIPDSPYFPVGQDFEQKPRFRKVLPDYSWSSIRSKRSAVLDESPVEKDEQNMKPNSTEVEKPNETTSMPTTVTQLNADVTLKRPNSTIDMDTISTDSETKTESITTTKKIRRPKKPKTITKIPKGGSKNNNKKNGGTKSNKNSQSKLDEKQQTNNNTKQNNNKTKSKLKKNISEAKVKNASATNVRAKSKGKAKKTAVGNMRAKNNVEKTNAKNKNNKTPTKAKTRSAKKKNDKKRNENTANKVPQRNTNRNRPKKGLKTRTTNGTRTGKKPEAQRRLIAAREALIEDYPYVVSIQKDEQHWCSGALLNPRLVITTANCLWKANRISRMIVRAGSRHTNRGGQMAGIQEVMRHPGWGLRRNPDNDVALLLLNKNIKFSHSVHGVDLPNRVMMPPFDDAWVTSWGSERPDGVYDNSKSTSLQVYHTRLIDREKCNNVTKRFSVVVTENFFCLAQSGRTAPCTRDTGAPAVSDGILWGLASWGIRKLCGTERFPAMFSYLASHSNMDFIANATRFLMSDERLYPFADRYPG